VLGSTTTLFSAVAALSPGLRAASRLRPPAGQKRGEAARHKRQQVISAEAAHRVGVKSGERAADLMGGKDPGDDDWRVSAPEPRLQIMPKALETPVNPGLECVPNIL
jgi:hypothetical protein